MTNEQVILKFLQKEKAQTNKRTITGTVYSYEGRTLTSNGQELINYSTVIAKHHNGFLYINNQKYSSTTSKIQTQLKRLATQQGFSIVNCNDEESTKECKIIFDDELVEG